MKVFTFFILTSFVIPAVCIQAHGQDNQRPTKVWLGLGVRGKFFDDWRGSFYRMYSFNTDPFEAKYHQNTLSLTYSPGKRWSFSGGYVNVETLRRENDNKIKHRFFGAITAKSRINDLRLYHSIRYEKHSVNETRFGSRIIYAFTVRPKSSLISKRLYITPYVGMQLYYNIGGKPISQYDQEGNRVGRFVPYGLHRLRVKTGVSMKPFKSLKIILFGMIQEEFNTAHSLKYHHRINVENPDSEKVTRRFNNYFVVGLNLKYYLNQLFESK